MNPIKEFFKKKKIESKFKLAGPGHKLTENAPRAQANAPRAVPSHHPQFSESAQRAGAAALARIEQKHQQPVNWSVQATKAKARKELELENAAANISSPLEIAQDSCPVLSVSGVYFSCPLVGPDILLKEEIEAKIKEFLYAQLEQERGLTACLIIHTCNKKQKVHIGVETLSKYLTNILDNPTEPKYRKIRFKNKIFQERIADLEGAFDFLTAAGFLRQILKQDDGEEEEYFVFQGDDFENLQMLKEALLSAEPILPILDRNMRVLMPSKVTEKIHLPSDFFTLSTDEIRREQEAKTEAAELSKQLRTKAMRERDEMKEIYIYKFTLVRIRFPDEILLQGTFHVTEKLFAIREFVSKNLSNPEREFILMAPGGFKLQEDDQTLLSLKLVPAVVLNFQWLNNESNVEKTGYLNAEAMLLLEKS